MTKYKCPNCKRVYDDFEEIKVINTTYESYYGVSSFFPNSNSMTLNLCPRCEEEVIEYEQDEKEEFIEFIDLLETSFVNSFYDKSKNLFMIKKNSRTNIMTLKIFEEDDFKLVLCRILERLTPIIVKYSPYKEKWRNDRLKQDLIEGLNKLFKVNLTYKEIELINDKIGGTINRSLTKKLINNKLNIRGVLK